MFCSWFEFIIFSARNWWGFIEKNRNTQFEEWKYQFRFLSIFSCLFFNFSALFEMEKLNEAQNIEHKFTIYFISNQKLDSHDMFTLNSIHFNIIFLAWSVRVCSSHFNRNISFKVIKLWSIDDLVVGVVCFFAIITQVSYYNVAPVIISFVSM